MMKLSEVTCEYMIKNGDFRPTEDIKADWESYLDEERKGWFTTRCERIKPDARLALDDIIERMTVDGYEEMDVMLEGSISETDVTKLQVVLDEIFDTSAADVYYPGEEIEG